MATDAERDRSIAAQPATLSALLDDVSSRAEASFLLCQERDWTYAEFSSAVDEFAAGLLGLGIRKGDRIALIGGSQLFVISCLSVTAGSPKAAGGKTFLYPAQSSTSARWSLPIRR